MSLPTMDQSGTGQAYVTGGAGEADLRLRAPGSAERLRDAVDRRLRRMREGMPWVRHAHPHLVETYGSVVDLDFGWRMVDATLRSHADGRLDLDDDRREALNDLWLSLTTEIIHAPRREDATDGPGMTTELGAAVGEHLERLRNRMSSETAASPVLAREYEMVVDLDFSWRMIEATLRDADAGVAALDDDRRESLETKWRELTAELVAALGRHRNVLETAASAERRDAEPSTAWTLAA